MHDQNKESRPLSRRALLTQMGSMALSVTALPLLGRIAHADTPWNRDYEMAVNFEIAPEDGDRYRRPFLAVWVEDASGAPVRTLSLWVQTRRPGPRWIPNLKRWYRDETKRQRSNGGSLIESISVATRQPGKYSVVWNGRNDDGKLVPQGNYTLCIEAAREHGTYQIIREDVTIGSKPFRKDLGSNVEVKGASVEYRKKN